MSEKTNEERAAEALRIFSEALVAMAEAVRKVTVTLNDLAQKAKEERET